MSRRMPRAALVTGVLLVASEVAGRQIARRRAAPIAADPAVAHRLVGALGRRAGGGLE